MVTVRLPLRGRDVSQIQGSNTKAPQHQHQSHSQTIPWVQDNEVDLLVTCCHIGSPYHKLICGHLIYSYSKGCGRTCRAAANSKEKLHIEFSCDRCADEQTFAEIIGQIREHWSAMILENRIILLKNLQPYIDTFTYHLTLGRRAQTGRRGRKAFAKTDEELGENLQILIEGLIERSCRYFLGVLRNSEGSDMYDEPEDDDEEKELAGKLLDDTEVGKIIEYEDENEDGGDEEGPNVPDLKAALSVRPHSQCAAGVQHKTSVVDSMSSSVDVEDSFKNMGDVMKAEKNKMVAQLQCSMKRRQRDGLEASKGQDTEPDFRCNKKARY